MVLTSDDPVTRLFLRPTTVPQPEPKRFDWLTVHEPLRSKFLTSCDGLLSPAQRSHTSETTRQISTLTSRGRSLHPTC
jgi:hypothetical protein